MIAPYFGENFFGFISIFFTRLFHGWPGGMASDELQLLVLFLISISSAIVGCFLSLGKMLMLANSLSHTILIGIVMALFLTNLSVSTTVSFTLNTQILLVASLITGLVTTFLTQFLTKKVGLQEDASTGLVFTTLFALGVVAATLFTRNTHIGIEAVMGNVDALHREDLKLIYLVTGLNLFLFILFFKQQTLVIFDPLLAKSLGVCVGFYNYLLMFQTAATVIGGFRAVGVLLIMAFLVAPYLIARLFFNHLHKLLLFAVFIGTMAAFFGVAFSRHLLSCYQIAVSTGALVTTFLGIFFLLALFVKKLFSSHLDKKNQGKEILINKPFVDTTS